MITAQQVTDGQGRRANWITLNGELKTSLSYVGDGYFKSLATKQVKFKVMTIETALEDDMYSLLAIRANGEGLALGAIVEVGANRTARYMKELNSDNQWLRIWAERKGVTHANRVKK